MSQPTPLFNDQPIPFPRRSHQDEIDELMADGEAAGGDAYLKWVQRTTYDRAAIDHCEREIRRVTHEGGDFAPMAFVVNLARQIAHIRRGGSVLYWSSSECACPEPWAEVVDNHCLGCGATDCRPAHMVTEPGTWWEFSGQWIRNRCRCGFKGSVMGKPDEGALERHLAEVGK